MGFVACGGGGGSVPASSSHTNEGAYNPVPSIDALPPSINPTTYQAPPSTYDTPPGQTNAGGIGTGPTIESACSELCNTVLSLNCAINGDSFSDQSASDGNGDGNGNGNGNSGADMPAKPAPAAIVSPDECTAACVKAEADVPCPNELAAALGCILDHIQLTCDLLTDTSSQDKLEATLAASCQTALLEYVGCRDSEPQPPQSGPDQNCMPDTCARCADGCERCLCQNNYDLPSCMMCPQQ